MAHRDADAGDLAHRQVVLADQTVVADRAPSGVGVERARRIGVLIGLPLVVIGPGEPVRHRAVVDAQGGGVGSLQPRAPVAAGAREAGLVIAPGIDPLHRQAVGPAAVHQRIVGAGEAIDAGRLGGAAGRVGGQARRAERLAVAVGVGGGPADHAAQPQRGADLIAQLGRQRPEPRADVARPARGDLVAAGRLIAAADRVVEAVVVPRRPRRAAIGPHAAALRAQPHARRLAPRGGDVVDHPADGVGTVDRALRAAQHLDAGHVVGQQGGVVELAEERVRRLDPVDQGQDVVALGAAHADLGEAADPAGAADRDPRHVAQHVGDDADLPVLEVLGGDHGDRCAELVGRHAVGAAGSGDQQVLDHGARRRTGRSVGGDGHAGTGPGGCDDQRGEAGVE